ncbi:type II toxin-antitoxin system death-on-curing family toxin [Parvularcula maris]|uniref:Type II toxin-antitoxin system death-on-curing family toxin n=1 Tax=Parvularcula maris TaxID=2965077 RepID=A0A9X2L9U9_9PROT|nr:type II toxin-antitoxin system death-on-curing family toxin [Parvularcula maris]
MTASIRWLTKPIVLKMHERSLADHGGAAGLRDEGLLDTALAKPLHLSAYDEPSVFDLAAAYLTGIGRAHAFVDGNKRTAFFAAYVFLGLNGYELDADEAEAAAVTIDVVTSKLSAEDLSRWLELFSRPV